MLLTVLALGSTLLGATTIAGLLMVYQIRQASDLNDSTRSIFAADTGIEWGLYQFLNPAGGASAPVMSDGASFTVTCYASGGTPVGCTDESTRSMRAVGQSGSVNRAFELNF